jgi:hypothetical protein
MLAVASSTRKIQGSLLPAPQIYRLIARGRISGKKSQYLVTPVAEKRHTVQPRAGASLS